MKLYVEIHFRGIFKDDSFRSNSIETPIFLFPSFFNFWKGIKFNLSRYFNRFQTEHFRWGYFNREINLRVILKRDSHGQM